MQGAPVYSSEKILSVVKPHGGCLNKYCTKFGMNTLFRIFNNEYTEFVQSCDVKDHSKRNLENIFFS